MLAAILGVLSALPEMINLAKEVFTFFKHIAGADPQGFIKASADAMAKLNNAKTPEDRTDAALAIQKLIAGL